MYLIKACNEQTVLIQFSSDKCQAVITGMVATVLLMS
jgi:hypothetical protein